MILFGQMPKSGKLEARMENVFVEECDGGWVALQNKQPICYSSTQEDTGLTAHRLRPNDTVFGELFGTPMLERRTSGASCIIRATAKGGASLSKQAGCALIS